MESIVDVAKRTIGAKYIHFSGPGYDPKKDEVRLASQLLRIFTLMADGNWRTLEEIHDRTAAPPASASAALRALRRERHGAHTVNRRARGDREHGLFEYQLVINTKSTGDTPSEEQEELFSEN
jgi:hypothetical protein